MKVYVLVRETNGREIEGDAELSIDSVYAREADAIAAKEESEADERAEGKVCYGDDDDDEWEIEYRVEAYDVIDDGQLDAAGQALEDAQKAAGTL